MTTGRRAAGRLPDDVDSVARVIANQIVWRRRNNIAYRFADVEMTNAGGGWVIEDDQTGGRVVRVVHLSPEDLVRAWRKARRSWPRLKPN